MRAVNYLIFNCKMSISNDIRLYLRLSSVFSAVNGRRAPWPCVVRLGPSTVIMLMSATLQADPSRRSRIARVTAALPACVRQRHLQLSSGGTTSIACEHTLGSGLGLGRPGTLLGWAPGWTPGWSGASS